MVVRLTPRMTQGELESCLDKAADMLRGNADQSEFRGYVSRCSTTSACVITYSQCSDPFRILPKWHRSGHDTVSAIRHRTFPLPLLGLAKPRV